MVNFLERKERIVYRICLVFTTFEKRLKDLLFRNTQINLVFRSVIRTFNSIEGRLHLRNTQINLVFRSVCTTFAL